MGRAGSKVWEDPGSKISGRNEGGEGGEGEYGKMKGAMRIEGGKGVVCPLLGVLNMVKVNTHCFSGLFKPGRQENQENISITKFTERLAPPFLVANLILSASILEKIV